VTYQVVVAPTARDALAAITDKRIQRNIYNRLMRLANDPDRQGEALTGNLDGYRSVRAANERYRIIYRVECESAENDDEADESEVIVSVVFIGIRREGSKSDVYVLFSNLIERL